MSSPVAVVGVSFSRALGDAMGNSSSTAVRAVRPWAPSVTKAPKGGEVSPAQAQAQDDQTNDLSPELQQQLSQPPAQQDQTAPTAAHISDLAGPGFEQDPRLARNLNQVHVETSRGAAPEIRVRYTDYALQFVCFCLFRHAIALCLALRLAPTVLFWQKKSCLFRFLSFFLAVFVCVSHFLQPFFIVCCRY